jgi:hypothetical protein
MSLPQTRSESRSLASGQSDRQAVLAPGVISDISPQPPLSPAPHESKYITGR